MPLQAVFDHHLLIRMDVVVFQWACLCEGRAHSLHVFYKHVPLRVLKVQLVAWIGRFCLFVCVLWAWTFRDLSLQTLLYNMVQNL